MVLDHLVDAKQRQRPPGESDGVGHAAFEHVTRLGRGGLHIGAAQHGDDLAHGGGGRAHLHAFDVGGTHHFFARVQGARVVCEGKAEMHFLHFLGGISPVPGINGGGAGLGVGDHEGQRGGCKDWETARLVAGVDVREIGNAITRHVVMVKRLAQLLGGEQGSVQCAARGLFETFTPGLQRRVEGVLCRDPARELEHHVFVLGLGRRQQAQRQGGDAPCKG